MMSRGGHTRQRPKRDDTKPFCYAKASFLWVLDYTKHAAKKRRWPMYVTRRRWRACPHQALSCTARVGARKVLMQTKRGSPFPPQGTDWTRRHPHTFLMPARLCAGWVHGRPALVALGLPPSLQPTHDTSPTQVLQLNRDFIDHTHKGQATHPTSTPAPRNRLETHASQCPRRPRGRLPFSPALLQRLTPSPIIITPTIGLPRLLKGTPPPVVCVGRGC